MAAHRFRGFAVLALARAQTFTCAVCPNAPRNSACFRSCTGCSRKQCRNTTFCRDFTPSGSDYDSSRHCVDCSIWDCPAEEPNNCSAAANRASSAVFGLFAGACTCLFPCCQLVCRGVERRHQSWLDPRNSAVRRARALVVQKFTEAEEVYSSASHSTEVRTRTLVRVSFAPSEGRQQVMEWKKVPEEFYANSQEGSTEFEVVYKVAGPRDFRIVELWDLRQSGHWSSFCEAPCFNCLLLTACALGIGWGALITVLSGCALAFGSMAAVVLLGGLAGHFCSSFMERKFQNWELPQEPLDAPPPPPLATAASNVAVEGAARPVVVGQAVQPPADAAPLPRVMPAGARTPGLPPPLGELMEV